MTAVQFNLPETDTALTGPFWPEPMRLTEEMILKRIVGSLEMLGIEVSWEQT